MERIQPDAAGIDIHLEEHWVAVPSGRDESSVRKFGTFTEDLEAIAAWLAHCGVTTVAMESTSVYWIPLYEVLEHHGFEVCLVNARATKNVSGRKTDLLDCQWIQQLHTYGLLQASFRPPADMVTLRSYVRQRDNLLRYRSMHIQQMQKALELMNLKLTSVISDITGLTGMRIIRAILEGEQNPHTLAQFRDPRCRKSTHEITKALTGNYQPEHIFLLRQSVELFDCYTHQLAACDAEIEAQYAAFEPQVDILEQPLPTTGPGSKRRRQANHPVYDLRTRLYEISGVDLTEVPGLDVLLVQDIITEIGLDMNQWPTEKHFTSWLALSPNHKITGGKVRSRKSKETKNRANLAFRLAARSVARSQSALGAFYRRLKTKHGAPKAITATARKIAVIVYHMLKKHEPYHDPGASYYEERYRERKFRNLNRQARQFGYRLEPVSTSVVT
ncbi:MAG: IS110 family transposase [Caldilineaceae bacterium]